jgi:prevent-host-death family protein
MNAPTRQAPLKQATSRRRSKGRSSRRWPAQEAKARFSELIRRAREEGPQVITLHGKEVATVTAIERVKGFSGRELIAAMQACPVKDIDFEAPPFYGTFQEIDL